MLRQPLRRPQARLPVSWCMYVVGEPSARRTGLRRLSRTDRASLPVFAQSKTLCMLWQQKVGHSPQERSTLLDIVG